MRDGGPSDELQPREMHVVWQVPDLPAARPAHPAGRVAPVMKKWVIIAVILILVVKAPASAGGLIHATLTSLGTFISSLNLH